MTSRRSAIRKARRRGPVCTTCLTMTPPDGCITCELCVQEERAR